MRIIVGLFIMAFGALITIKSEWLYKNLGSIGFAERYFATSGGTRFFYKLLGIAIAVIGILVVTNIIKVVLMAIFSKLFGGFNAQTL